MYRRSSICQAEAEARRMARLETARSAASGGDGWESHSRLHAFVPASIQGRRGAPWWATGRTPPGVKPLTNALARLLLTVREDRAGLDVVSAADTS
jgi:hypothetical protein